MKTAVHERAVNFWESGKVPPHEGGRKKECRHAEDWYMPRLLIVRPRDAARLVQAINSGVPNL